MEPVRERRRLETQHDPRFSLLTALAALIGLVSGGIAWALYHLIGLITNLLYFGTVSATFANPFQSPFLGNPVLILFPILGALAAGLMIKYGSTKIIGHGIPEVMESILEDRSKIKLRVGVLKALSAALTIGSGQPFGAEGPIIQTGGTFGSFTGQIVPMTGLERRILLASGAAAGMAAVFGTPISAVFLVLELLLFEFRVKSLVPIGVAAALGYLSHVYLIQSTPLFFVASLASVSIIPVEILPLYVVLGLICGAVGSVLTRALYATERLYVRLPLKQPWLPALGGLLVGIIGFAVPESLGVGYAVITDVLSGQFLVAVIAVVLIAKAASWLLAMGSQTSGGTLAPLFLIGASVGSLFGTGVSAALPAIGGFPLSSGIFAVAAMAAVFGTASRAPWASIVFAVEATSAYNLLPAVMITVLVAELVGEYLMEDSIMTERLAQRGLRVRNIYEYNPLRQARVGAVMAKPIITVRPDQTLSEVVHAMVAAKGGNPTAPKAEAVVVMQGDKILGMIDRRAVIEAFGRRSPDVPVEQLGSRVAPVVREDDLAYEALRILALQGINLVLVADPRGQPVGYVTPYELLQEWRKKVEDEVVRERVLPLRRRRPAPGRTERPREQKPTPPKPAAKGPAVSEEITGSRPLNKDSTGPPNP